MITKRDRMINQLLGAIYIDNNDKSMYRVNVENIIKILIQNDLVIPPRQFEDTLEMVLNEKLAGKAKINQATKYAIATIICQIAEQLHVTRDEIIKFQLQGKEYINENKKS